MNEQTITEQPLACNLEMTNNARNGLAKWADTPHSFFAMQDTFHVHIEKRPNNRQGNIRYSIFFDNETNDPLSERLDERVAVMECVAQQNGFLATGFHVRGRREPVRTNRRLSVRLKFLLDRRAGATMPIELYTQLRELPVADERSEYVEKRIASWEGYLRIQEKNADVEDVTATYGTARISEDFSKLRLHCNGLQNKHWRTIIGFSAKLTGMGQDIGNVVHANRSKQLIEIELNPRFKRLVRRNEWHPINNSEVTFSNFAELSQIRRLRRGFKDLQDGLAANANLEKILFEERPVVRISKSDETFEFHSNLNEFQRQAVIGAMTSNDLYVIQGPPGTGKTTVIAEICYQNVKAGLKTLVASQANLAVDNALGRLMSHQDIRILRRGRTDSIEEEGQKYIEENVAFHWKNDTLHAVQEQLRFHDAREVELDEELGDCEQQVRKIEEDLELLEQQIKQKEAAQAEYDGLSETMAAYIQKVIHIQQKLDRSTAAHVELAEVADDLAKEMSILHTDLQTEVSSEKAAEEMEVVAKEIDLTRTYIAYFETMRKIGDHVNVLASVQQQLEDNRKKADGLNIFLTELQFVTKYPLLASRLNEEDIMPSAGTKEKMERMQRLIAGIQAMQTTGDFQAWKTLHDRLSTAITTVEKLLGRHGFLKYPVHGKQYAQYQSVEAIHELVDRIGRFLVNPSTKEVLANRHYSAQKYDYLEKIAIALYVLVERSQYVQQQNANVTKYTEMIAASKTLFSEIKAEVNREVTALIAEIERMTFTLQTEAEDHQTELANLRQENSKRLERLGAIEETLTMDMVQEKLSGLLKTYSDHEERQAKIQRTNEQLKSKEAAAEKNEAQLKEIAETIQTVTEEQEALQAEIADLQKRLDQLAEKLAAQPEAEWEQLRKTYDLTRQKIETLKVEKVRLPMTRELQQQWLTLLTEANDYDLDEIRKLYVKHANVIGTTCVASASRDFMEQYPTFDVVIIDEVSKATPPELLLPMLKGKKIILVGDHHQLPPLIGHETVEEFLEEHTDLAEKNELKKLLNESLFERLFRTLPKQNKTMLGIQYRMHESIMETITPFYDAGDYRLQCGLTDSDAVRDHLLESKYVTRKDHLLWFDMPNEPAYFEEKVKGGTSRFNEAELAMIRKLLIDLEQATLKAKQEGRLEQEALKSVGVISFYGEQVKRIDRLIDQELNPQQLHCRTGSVDKFQGMEMDVIILSFVRNHRDQSGDIGFARDYRRLNVALSRARELLIIVGSADMFTKRVKDDPAKRMYGRLLDEIKKKNGLKTIEVRS